MTPMKWCVVFAQAVDTAYWCHHNTLVFTVIGNNEFISEVSANTNRQRKVEKI